MAGHSKFKNIQHRKGAQDAKRAKVFNKIARDISVAVKQGGEDESANPRLRAAIIAGRAVNMPNDRVSRAIKSGSGADSQYAEDIRYEGYGPDGTALIIEALTDNRNRTAAEVRAVMARNNGILGESGTVTFQFNQLGQLYFKAGIADAETMFEAAVEAGADNVESDADGHTVSTSVNEFGPVLDALTTRFGSPEESGLVWEPMNPVSVSGDTADKVVKLINALEDLEDVQQVFTNVDMDDVFMEKLSA